MYPPLFTDIATWLVDPRQMLLKKGSAFFFILPSQILERSYIPCQDRCKNPQNNRAKNPQVKRSKVGYFSFRLVTGSGEEDERSLSLRR